MWRTVRVTGDTATEREVSFLELFSDLVYVALVAAIAHDLAHHMEWASVDEFCVMFGLAWVAWLHGAAEFELHGRDDLRARAFTFAQMLLVVLLAVFVSDEAAAGRDRFAVAYCILFAVLAWQWQTVQRRPSVARRSTRWYQVLAGLTIAVMAVSTTVAPRVQLWIWAAVVTAWVATGIVMPATSRIPDESAIITRSFVERFGLFTIVVLGEVVFGVVNGLRESERGPLAILVAMVALCVGFGLWWNYFDLVGRRLPRRGPSGLRFYIPLHLPLTMAIAGGGAAMITLIERAADPRAPEVAAWILAGSVGVFLLCLAAVVLTLEDWNRNRAIYLPASAVTVVLVLATVPTLGFVQPKPILLAASLLALLNLTWAAALYQRIRVRADIVASSVDSS